jgi:hypothetical protein
VRRGSNSGAIDAAAGYNVAMLTEDDIQTIALNVARASLGSSKVVSVMSEPTVDSVGDAALAITIVLTPEATDSISGDAVIKSLSGIQQALQAAGDHRFPIVDYVTTDELVDVAD